MTLFADRLIDATRRHGPLCVGIDPHAGKVPALFGGDTPEGIEAWGRALVECCAGTVACIKPQVAFYERHGPEGLKALQSITRAAREAGLIVLMDAKRGDIGSTAEGYAAAFLGKDAPFEGDALTVNPYMGLDTIEPYVREAEAHGRGVIVLVRTSNPGSADFQSRSLEGAPLYARVAEAMAPMAERLKGRNGWSGLMMVTGATGPDEARTIRDLAPSSLFLVPGYGAQGASAAEALAGFVQGPGGLEGGVVSSSRGVNFPDGSGEAGDVEEWKSIISAAIAQARADLRGLPIPA
ncbi:MAG TPA: orotidine-5'-phosphate decarboxylase [Hyphomonas sp.]|nr:orotidine-5'-phosphate decarboxylase [Hyphomonas sp.]MCA8906107.1 orotidine-5'-phosphate decarboxylase [Hyphomonas sp.]MCB9961990.1 orotidine-5'-phosphate decarboxylase [Hyphomonas sp.]MCB9970982.1 orotidine-5'-phosphate decarboxylase [Hyphomonas sp.]HPE48184.1 orotidine-5'-phosphate decarboxylase [Hyphomonas sp.]